MQGVYVQLLGEKVEVVGERGTKVRWQLPMLHSWSTCLQNTQADACHACHVLAALQTC